MIVRRMALGVLFAGVIGPVGALAREQYRWSDGSIKSGSTAVERLNEMELVRLHADAPRCLPSGDLPNAGTPLSANVFVPPAFGATTTPPFVTDGTPGAY